MTYTPATQDQLLAIRVNAGIEELAQSEKFAAAEPDMVEAIVGGIGEFAAGEWAPLNRVGDLEGAKLENGVVTLPDGFAAAYEHYVEQGWNAISGPTEFGGQGLPFTLSCNVLENLGTANMAFNLLPMLSVGAIESLEHHGSPELQQKYLPKLVSGEWSGTMNLTEPQAGSDVGALRTTAHLIEDGEHAGKYRIKGQKIYITWGEHDLAKNIIHLVLARLPDAPEGSRGISLFVVPKYHVKADGSPGAHNDVRCVSIEHKLGINASPTCVMSYGDNDECIGELVGAENRGLMAMFTMMNNARINVGNQGVQIGERATQQAQMYARERIQSARAGSPDKAPVAILEHPDVRRMLLRMKALTEGARALLYYTAGQVDRGTLGDSAARARGEVLTPLIKAWGTEIGIEVASLGVQVHGGMGFVEETGAAQHWRDSRIAPIYEGTNGIQAADLVTRKLGMDGGEALTAVLADIARDAGEESGLAALAADCESVALWMREEASLDDRLAGSVPFCTMFAVAVAGWQLLRQKRAVEGGAAPGLAATKQASVRFFLDRVVPEAAGLKASATAGAEPLYALSAEQFIG
ncbi:acyl-CoA dehydrogenase [Qipengyuania flava]|uniref:acyl-CoA dehydrogenase n=1 Tax=Qipengyuania flava TaxID=192812 RepID=UPI001C59E1DA|nr:acyl-CoA dehydrogenase [Qipengyuania flava]MBW3166881.1 acyl-CoA dehydrogenase [Qipengyuania flava]MBY5964119.1 acyl-CoA dehydrogenase [Qipengyuania flava]MBY6010443.1 acyl-CoA dehydrogenase [Qipengyuania flava]MBY6024885.1 acyl-CoA dehydrogenase [Qipengyuania flava]